MYPESPENLLYVIGGAFLLGWLTGKVGAWFGRRFQPTDRDPRDDRIRSLEADLRVARRDVERSKEALEDSEKEQNEARELADQRQQTIDALEETLSRVRADLKESVQKTRELRAELSDRATENLKSEVRLREIETELSIVQASSDMMATGALQYDVNDDENDDVSTVFTPGGS